MIICALELLHPVGIFEVDEWFHQQACRLIIYELIFPSLQILALQSNVYRVHTKTIQHKEIFCRFIDFSCREILSGC